MILCILMWHLKLPASLESGPSLRSLVEWILHGALHLNYIHATIHRGCNLDSATHYSEPDYRKFGGYFKRAGSPS